jgi:homoserine kinase type II
MPADPTLELTEVLSHYDLGELVQQEKDERGTVNTSFFIETVKSNTRRKYFLRRYKRGVGREEILFEHSLIDHIVRQGACPVARVHPTRQGATFVHGPDPGGDPEGAYYAIFDFLPGEDRYTWVGPRCTRNELHHAGRLLAAFHDAVSTLTPQGKRAEPKIVDLLEGIGALWAEGLQKTKGTVFDACLAEHFDLVRRSIAEARTALQTPDAQRMPEVIIHLDYHPGNLKFEGEEITGLVDFDWAKVDLRAFDVALALWYFCVSWEGHADGRLRLGEARTFLMAYQDRLLAKSVLPPLSALEIACLPDLLNASNLYVVYWTIRDYFGKPVDPEEYLVYLKHHVGFARWIGRRANRDRLSTMLLGLPRR